MTTDTTPIKDFTIEEQIKETRDLATKNGYMEAVLDLETTLLLFAATPEQYGLAARVLEEMRKKALKKSIEQNENVISRATHQKNKRLIRKASEKQP